MTSAHMGEVIYKIERLGLLGIYSLKLKLKHSTMKKTLKKVARTILYTLTIIIAAVLYLPLLVVGLLTALKNKLQ